MRKLMLATLAGILVLGSVGVSLGDHTNPGPGKSDYGHCIAITSGNGDNKFDSEGFQKMFGDLEDQDGDDDVDRTDAIIWCQMNLLNDEDQRPGKAGDNCVGRPGQVACEE